MSDFNFDIFDIDQQNGESIGDGWPKYGKCSMTGTKYFQWPSKEEKANGITRPFEIDRERFVQKGGQKYIEFVLSVNVHEFFPDAPFEYERTLRTSWWKKNTDTPNNWLDVFWPSACEATGEKEFSKVMKKLVGSYVLFTDVVQPETAGKEKTYNMPRVDKLFSSREECFAAYTERFPNGEGGSKTGNTLPAGTPPAWDTDALAMFMEELAVIATLPKPAQVSVLTEIANEWEVSVDYAKERLASLS